MRRALLLLVVMLPAAALAQNAAPTCAQNGPCTLSRLNVRSTSTLLGTVFGAGQLKLYGDRTNTAAGQAIYISDASTSTGSAGWLWLGDASSTAGNFAPKIEGGSWGAAETGLTFKSTIANDTSTAQSAFEFDTGITHANSYLMRVKNNGSTKFLLDPGGAVISSAASGSVGFSVSQGAKFCAASSSKCIAANSSTLTTDAPMSIGGTVESGSNIFQCGSGSTSACEWRNYTGTTTTVGAYRLRYLGGSGTWTSSTVPFLTLENNGNIVFAIDKDGNPTFTNTTAAAPTCDSTRRGMHHYTRSANGTTDSEEVCMKSAADTYSWRTVITGG